MNVTITKEYWVLADVDKEYFLTCDHYGNQIDWVSRIGEAWKFPSEESAIVFNKIREYDLISKDEVFPIKVKNTTEF